MEYHIKIEKIITGGKGLGYLKDGMVAMVPHVLPGEQVHIRETKRFRGHITADPISISHPSPLRKEPPCPYFTICGGCSLQHAEYNEQLRIKREILLESLTRAGIQTTAITVHPTLPSPLPYGYRNKIRLHCSQQGDIGFHRCSSNRIVPITACPLAPSGINQALDKLLHNGECRQVLSTCRAVEIIQSPENGDICMVVDFGREITARKQLHSLQTITDHVFSKKRPKDGDIHKGALRMGQKFRLDTLSYTLYWDHNCFFQVNASQNEHMVNLIVNILRQKQPGTLLDLFCGTGNFSIPLTLAGCNVHGVEHNRHSTGWAQTNAQLMQCDESCKFTAKNVVSFLQTKQHTNYDAIVLDPPRQGLGKENAHTLAQGNAACIIYISCDPATLSRDLAVLTTSGYHCRDIFPVDMFPQTHHIESVAVLEKN